ncbi:DUF2567 domain-containing protein [Micromonospora echinofusca]|uniref:DUF2567 domain-containing protein n=1 Tax=Micromonospora echinofusca TaxID=47858 RepID=A0ABS3VNB5_MICEH|nr:DUF2567 domain-containing protein [Micromonospora echinofusca]MBO4206033.1 DUF2567 domain-containing protein [Micromonospora echinofusca]
MSQPTGEPDRPVVDSAYVSSLTLSVDPPRRPGRTVGTCAGAGLALTVLGVPLGLLWYALAPRVPVVRTADGAVLAEPQPEQFIAADGWFSLLGLGFGVLAAIGVWLLLRRVRGPLGLVVAVLGSVGAALVAWRLGRQIGLADYQRLLAAAEVGQALEKPADLRAGGVEWLLGVIPTIQGDVLVPAFAAAVTYTLLAGWSQWPSLRPETEPQPWVPMAGPDPEFGADPAADPSAAPEFGADPAADPSAAPGAGAGPAAPGVSWGSAVPPAPPAAPGPPGPDAAEPPRG